MIYRVDLVNLKNIRIKSYLKSFMEIQKTLICHLLYQNNASCIMLFSVYVVTLGLSLILFLCPCEENRLWGQKPTTQC